MSELTPTQEVVKQIKMERIAALYVTGKKNYREIATDVGLSIPQVKRLINTSEFRNVLRDIGDEATTQALSLCRSEMVALMKKAVRVFHQHLDEGNLQAAIEVMKMSGITKVDDRPVENTGLTIIMPGAEAPQPKTVDSTVVHMESNDGREPNATE